MTKESSKKKSFSFGKMFEVQLLYRNLTFLVFLTLIGIIYIANGHRAEKKVRTIQKLQGEIEKSKWRYMESNSDVGYEGLQSETEKRVEDLGLTTGEGSIKIIEKDPQVQENK